MNAFAAIAAGDLEALRRALPHLLSHGAEPAVQTDEGQTAADMAGSATSASLPGRTAAG